MKKLLLLIFALCSINQVFAMETRPEENTIADQQNIDALFNAIESQNNEQITLYTHILCKQKVMVKVTNEKGITVHKSKPALDFIYDNAGRTPLLAAIFHDDSTNNYWTTAVLDLITAGADPNICGEKNTQFQQTSPIQYAIELKKFHLLIPFIRYGAQVEGSNKYTPIFDTLFDQNESLTPEQKKDRNDFVACLLNTGYRPNFQHNSTESMQLIKALPVYQNFQKKQMHKQVSMGLGFCASLATIFYDYKRYNKAIETEKAKEKESKDQEEKAQPKKEYHSWTKDLWKKPSQHKTALSGVLLGLFSLFGLPRLPLWYVIPAQ